MSLVSDSNRIVPPSLTNASPVHRFPYYHREYSNDVPTDKEADKGSWVHTAKRAGMVALPFLSLCKPLSFPISLGMGALRTYTWANQLFASIQSGNTDQIPQQLLQTSIAVIALAGTVFAHPVGMLISTGHDLILDVIRLTDHLQKGEYQQAMESCFSIINNALYLALFTHGGLELAIASLAMQIMLGIYHSQAEFRKGNYLEATGHLLMSMVRGTQLAGQAKNIKRPEKIKSSNACLSKTDAGLVSMGKEELNEIVTGQDENLERKIANQLRGVVSEQELITILQLVHNRQKIDPNSTLILFASIRGEKTPFSSSEVKEIANVLSQYDEQWKGLELNEVFWKNLCHAAFGGRKQFPDESEHYNYEAQRLVHSIHHQRNNNQLVSTSLIEKILSTSLISEVDKEEKLWKLAHGLAYEREIIFSNESWKENFDIAYQTQAFELKMQQIQNAHWQGGNDNDLIGTINAFPKTSRICLRNFTRITSHGLSHAIKTSHKYLRDFDSTNCGEHRYDGESDFDSINNTVIDELSKCKELRSMYGNCYFFGQTLESAISRILSHCPMLERAELYNLSWYNGRPGDVRWSFRKTV